MEKNNLVIDGKEYVLKSSIQTQVLAKKHKDMPYVIVRTYSAGVFAGYLKKRTGKEGEIIQARRLWYWKGAASLSQLAVDGVSCPLECKFSKPVDEVVTEIIEVLNTTEKARLSIGGVKEWEA